MSVSIEHHALGSRVHPAVLALAVVGAVVASGLVEGYAAYQQSVAAVGQLQREKAVATATTIERYFSEIEHQVAWATYLARRGEIVTPEQRREAYLRLLRQFPGIVEVWYADAAGYSVLGLSRVAMTCCSSGEDFSAADWFQEARARRKYYGPFELRNVSEPYWSMALADDPPDGGVTAAWASMKFVWDVVARVRVGEAGLAYVVDHDGRVVAHPDLSLVVARTDLAALPQVSAALAAPPPPGQPSAALGSGRTLQGDAVISTAVALDPPGWLLIVEQPHHELLAPVYDVARRTLALLLVGIVVTMLASRCLLLATSQQASI